MTPGQIVNYITTAGPLPAVVTKVRPDGTVNVHVFPDPEAGPISPGYLYGLAAGNQPGQVQDPTAPTPATAPAPSPAPVV